MSETVYTFCIRRDFNFLDRFLVFVRLYFVPYIIPRRFRDKMTTHAFVIRSSYAPVHPSYGMQFCVTMERTKPRRWSISNNVRSRNDVSGHHCIVALRVRIAIRCRETATKIYYPCVHGVTCPGATSANNPAGSIVSGRRNDHGSKDSNRVRPVDPRARSVIAIRVIPHARALSIIAAVRDTVVCAREHSSAGREGSSWLRGRAIDSAKSISDRLRPPISGNHPAERCTMIPMSGRMSLKRIMLESMKFHFFFFFF